VYFKLGALARAGVLIRELSHLYDVGATNLRFQESSYGVGAALGLVKAHEIARALDNAENWRYFATSGK
jgi:hypothetical protein